MMPPIANPFAALRRPRPLPIATGVKSLPQLPTQLKVAGSSGISFPRLTSLPQPTTTIQAVWPSSKASAIRGSGSSTT